MKLLCLLIQYQNDIRDGIKYNKRLMIFRHLFFPDIYLLHSKTWLILAHSSTSDLIIS